MGHFPSKRDREGTPSWHIVPRLSVRLVVAVVEVLIEAKIARATGDADSDPKTIKVAVAGVGVVDASPYRLTVTKAFCKTTKMKRHEMTPGQLFASVGVMDKGKG